MTRQPASRIWGRLFASGAALALVASILIPGFSPRSALAATGFTDVPATHPFHSQITWLADRGVTKGWQQPDGSWQFRPGEPVARDAMAAFLYRLAGEPTYSPPSVSPFIDVPSNRVFYKEISWLASRGITTGWAQPDGTRRFEPLSSVNRDAMAAFMYRYAGQPVWAQEPSGTFSDVPSGAPFAKEISWLAARGVTTGYKQEDGSRLFKPTAPVARDAMAAFMYRLATARAPIVTGVEGAGRAVQVAWEPNDAIEGVTEYRVTATPEPGSGTAGCASPTAKTVSVSGSDTLAWISGLCAGVPYRVHVVGLNAYGPGTASPASQIAVPWAPTEPRMPLLAPPGIRDGALLVEWTAPAFDGGTPLTGYTLTVTDPDGTVVATQSPTAAARSTTVTGLTNGVEYQVALVARNAVGASAPSQSNGTPAPATAPQPPLQAMARPTGASTVALAWSAPADNGGSPVTGYQISYQRVEETADGQWQPASGAPTHTVSTSQLAATITDFETQQAMYRFSIEAISANGASEPLVMDEPVSPFMQVAERTIILTTPTVNGALITPNRLDWPAPAPAQTAGIDVGSVLVAGTTPSAPSGLLRKVTAIKRDALGTHAETVEAGLDDVFANMTMSMAVSPMAPSTPGALAGQAAGGFVPSTGGVQSLPTSSRLDLSLSRTLALEVATDRAAVSGQLGLSNTTKLGIRVSRNWIGIPNGATVRASSVLTLATSASVKVTGQYEKKIGEIKGPKATFMVGPVPVVVNTEIPVYLTAEGSIGMNLSVQTAIGGELKWKSSSPGELKTKNLSKAPHGNGSTTGVEASGALGFRCDFAVLIYGSGGPKLGATAKLNITGNPFADPGEPYLTVDLELGLEAGLTFDRFGVRGDVTVSMGLLQWRVFALYADGRAPWYDLTPPQSTVQPGAALTIPAVRSDGATPALTWQVLGGLPGDTITAGGTFTAAEPGGRSVTIRVTDATGARGETVIHIGEPLGPPEYLQARITQAGLVVTWWGPQSTGGMEIADYLVYADPGLGSWVTPENQLTITGLALTTQKITIRVYARTTSGIISPVASIGVKPLYNYRITDGKLTYDHNVGTSCVYSAGSCRDFDGGWRLGSMNYSATSHGEFGVEPGEIATPTWGALTAPMTIENLAYSDISNEQFSQSPCNRSVSRSTVSGAMTVDTAVPSYMQVGTVLRSGATITSASVELWPAAGTEPRFGWRTVRGMDYTVSDRYPVLERTTTSSGADGCGGGSYTSEDMLIQPFDNNALPQTVSAPAPQVSVQSCNEARTACTLRFVGTDSWTYPSTHEGNTISGGGSVNWWLDVEVALVYEG